MHLFKKVRSGADDCAALEYLNIEAVGCHVDVLYCGLLHFLLLGAHRCVLGSSAAAVLFCFSLENGTAYV